jgi:hypothetical protein
VAADCCKREAVGKRLTTAAVWLPLLAGCALAAQDASATTVRHRFVSSPQKAAACVAHNAEDHSSALVAEVRPPDARGHVEVIVRVRNGVTYATAELRPAGKRADGTIALMVVSSRGARELVRSLVKGC